MFASGHHSLQMKYLKKKKNKKKKNSRPPVKFLAILVETEAFLSEALGIFFPGVDAIFVACSSMDSASNMSSNKLLL